MVRKSKSNTSRIGKKEIKKHQIVLYIVSIMILALVVLIAFPNELESKTGKAFAKGYSKLSLDVFSRLSVNMDYSTEILSISTYDKKREVVVDLPPTTPSRTTVIPIATLPVTRTGRVLTPTVQPIRTSGTYGIQPVDYSGAVGRTSSRNIVGRVADRGAREITSQRSRETESARIKAARDARDARSTREAASKPGVDEKKGIFAECQEDSECVSNLCATLEKPGMYGEIQRCVLCETDFELSFGIILKNYDEMLCSEGTFGNSELVCDQNNYCTVPVIKIPDNNQPSLTNEEKEEYKECIVSGGLCYDTELPLENPEDLWDKYTSGTVYSKKTAATFFDFADSNIPVFDNNGNQFYGDSYNSNLEQFWTCERTPDTCKDGYVVEAFCGEHKFFPDENDLEYTDNPLNCACGCFEGACLPDTCLIPDLEIKKISETTYDVDCKSYLEIEFCNIGNAPVINDFFIKVSANNEDEIIPFSVGDLDDGEIKPEQCITINNIEKLSVSKFGMDYGGTYEVLVDLDLQKDIDESNEDNNDGSVDVSLGIAYYDGTNYCLCGCTADTGLCAPCPQFPELQVKKISSVVNNLLCESYISIEFCNVGEIPVTEMFEIEVSGNENDVDFEFYPATLEDGELKVDQCIIIDNEITISELDINYGDELTEVTVNLDKNNDIEELIEDNNEESASVNPGEEYFDGTEYCYCGCSAESGKCLSCPADLVMKEINSETNDILCKSYITFKFCNEGALPITDSFVIKATANDEAETFTFNPGEYFNDGELSSGECIIISDQFFIEDFDMVYGESYDIVIELDDDNEIVEATKDNNVGSELLSLNQAYFDGTDYCVCGCADGICIPCTDYPDLIINDISDEIHHELCTSSVVFEFCNIGAAPVKEKFSFVVSANDGFAIVNFDPSKHDKLINEETGEHEIKSMQCIEITDLDKLTIDEFDIAYGGVQEFKVEADFGKQIEEEDEDNNDWSEFVSTDTGYFDGTEYCQCECNINTGMCVACPTYPDLVVDIIYDEVKTENCVNSFYFKICNQGQAFVENEFKIAATLNEVTKYYSVKGSKLETLNNEICMDINVPGLFNVGGYGAGLDEYVEVTINIDSEGVIGEEEEGNNELTTTVYTGDNYYLDLTKTEQCDTYCFEGDEGKDYDLFGAMTFKYSGEITDTEDVCSPWDLNKVYLREKFCKEVYKKDNGKFSNPNGLDNYNCLDSVPPRKCDSGACVPLTVTCDLLYPDQPCLQCKDYEGFSDETLALGWVNNDWWIENNIDPFVAGEFEYVDIDNVKWENPTKDECDGTEYVIDYYCSQYSEYPILNDEEINCYMLKNLGKENKPGHVCEKGKCVESEIDLEECKGPKENELDVFEQRTTVQTKLLGEKDYDTDHCTNDGDDVRKYYCQHFSDNDIIVDGVLKEKYYKVDKTMSCDELVDENGLGASCVSGECRFFSEDNKECSESDWGDIGYDPENDGGIEYITGYGLDGWMGEYCNDGNILIETYCDGVEPIIAEHSCLDEGKICKDSTCVEANEENLDCDESSDKGYSDNGWIEVTNIYGKTLYLDDLCLDPEEEDFLYDGEGNLKEPSWQENKFFNILWSKESDALIEISCDGKKSKLELVDCKDELGENYVCYEGACIEKSDDFKSCQQSPYSDLEIEYTDEFNNIGYFSDYCADEYTLFEAECDGNDPVHIGPITCPEGTACNSDTHECMEPFNDEIKCEELENNVVQITIFFEIYKHYPDCIGNTLNIPHCVSANSEDIYWTPEPCSEDSKCIDKYSISVSSGGGGIGGCKGDDCAVEEEIEEVPTEPAEDVPEGDVPEDEGPIEEEGDTGDECSEDSDCVDGYECSPQKYAGGVGECVLEYEGGKCVEPDITLMSCEETDWGVVNIVNEYGQEHHTYPTCNNDNTASEKPVCKNEEDFVLGELLFDFISTDCESNEKCNGGSDQCEPYSEEKNNCEYIEGEEGYVPYYIFDNGFLSSEPQIIPEWCHPGQEDIEEFFCVYEDGEYYLDDDEKECNNGQWCNPETMDCETPNYASSSCVGPASEEENNIYVKDTLIGTDMFGNELYIISEQGKKIHGDFCLKDFDPEKDKDEIVQFWCKKFLTETGEYVYLIEGDDNDCPDGTTCQDGACAIECGYVLSEDDIFTLGGIGWQYKDLYGTGDNLFKAKIKNLLENTVQEFTVSIDEEGKGTFNMNIKGNAYQFSSTLDPMTDNWDIEYLCE